MRAPCSKTRAKSKSSNTVSHRVGEKPELMLRGAAVVDTPSTMAPTVIAFHLPTGSTPKPP